ncbi:MAG: site-2 protease family protein [Acidimicrobiia bacterium]|nr:site-2 protease family protein [Acidimicrobiia bacterium]
MSPAGPYPAAATYSYYSRPRRRSVALHAALLLLTLLTTTAMGARLAINFEQNLPAFSDHDFQALMQIVRNPALLLMGLPFSLTLLTILMAHELGHYFACVYYRVDATLPYFLPAPTLIGTFGAFIRIRSPIYSRAVLFDIGIAGPLAGFLFLLPALAIGLANSKVLPGIAVQGDLIFGAPLMERWVTALVFPGVAGSDVYLHPVARAAWVGLLATALNLLPIGQLDGGHILYALLGKHHKLLSRFFVLVLVVLGLTYSYSWLLWALLLLVFGMRHPVIHDPGRLGGGRKRLALLALLIFVVSFTVSPVEISGFQ